MKFNTIDEIKQELVENHLVTVKYVRIGDEYRFIKDHLYAPDHSDMVKENEKATSAAYFKLYRNRLEIVEWSMTLKLGPDATDYKQLPELFGLTSSNAYLS